VCEVKRADRDSAFIAKGIGKHSAALPIAIQVEAFDGPGASNGWHHRACIGGVDL
jgi:hypothetical protein